MSLELSEVLGIDMWGLGSTGLCPQVGHAPLWTHPVTVTLHTTCQLWMKLGLRTCAYRLLHSESEHDSSQHRPFPLFPFHDWGTGAQLYRGRAL
jgi:hypothetical protein